MPPPRAAPPLWRAPQCRPCTLNRSRPEAPAGAGAPERPPPDLAAGVPKPRHAGAPHPGTAPPAPGRRAAAWPGPRPRRPAAPREGVVAGRPRK